MPEKKTIERARRDAREGKSPTTQAGEFVREEIEHIRQRKHGARSTKQAIAIGLSKARRAGVKLPPPKKGRTSQATARKAQRDLETGSKSRTRSPSPGRSRAVRGALKREPTSAGSRGALSRQARTAAQKRPASERSSAAREGAKTKGPKRRSAAARKAAASRRRASDSGDGGTGPPNRWSRGVMETSNALDLEDGVFRQSDPDMIARSLKRSAEKSTRRKASPFRSAMSMLNFYVNRAGKNLPKAQQDILQAAKQSLRNLFGRGHP